MNFVFHSTMRDEKTDKVVEDWLLNSEFEDGDATMCDTVRDEPEIAWSAILKILEQSLTDEQFALLAAGPLEDLLAMHGLQFIERVEHEAEKNPRFKELLGGVWQNQMTMEIWGRVEKARSRIW